MKFRSYLASFIVVISMIFSINVKAEEAEEDVRITINEGVQMAQPIAIVPFNTHIQVPEDIAKIISDDLRNSGKFNPLFQEKMPEMPNSIANINTEQWVDLGVDNIVIGQLDVSGSGYNVSYKLVDTLGVSGSAGNVIDEGAFYVEKNKIRLAAHTISDAIFEKLTQIKGAFRTKIAYVVQRGVASYQLKISDYDGYNTFTVFNSKEPLMSPAWSPDGNKLAYVSFENRKSQLVLHDINTGKRSILASYKGHNGAPSFSPDGSKIAFASNKDGHLNLYVKSVYGNQTIQLTHKSGNNTEPSWSSDGSELIFTSDRSGIPQVYSINLVDGALSLIGEGGSYSAKYSSDGKYIIMVGNDKIMKKEIETGNTEILSSTFLDESPSISPNDTMIIYSSTKGVSKVLQLVSADGRFKANLPGVGGQYKFPAWSPYLIK